MQQWRHRSSKILVTGKSGSGKTSYGLRYLTNVDGYRYKFIFDGESELAERLGISACYNPDQLLAALRSRWILFDPTYMFRTPKAASRFFCDWTFRLCRHLPGKKLILIDELWKHTNTSTVAPEIEDVVFTGRRAGLDCLFLSQRPNRIHNSIRDALSEVVCFRLQDANSLKFVLENGFDEAQIRSLQPGQFIAMNIDTGAVDAGRIF